MSTYAPDIHSGGESSVVIDGVDVGITNFTDSSDYTLVPITTTKDYNPTKKITRSRKKATMVTDNISFDAYVDMANDVLAILEGVSEPGVIENVVVAFSAAKSRSYPLLILKTIARKSGGVEGVNAYSVTAESQGDHPN